MRRQLSLKSNTCTESGDVDVAGISVKVSNVLPGEIWINNDVIIQKSAEVIVP
jgi:hypothetical protein